MAIVPVTRERHTGKAWVRFTDYTFAAGTNVVPLAAKEIPHAARTLPLAFIEFNGKPTLSALLGIASGQNLFVAPDGRWLGSYVPAALRAHPFRLARVETAGIVLCIDESSGLVRDVMAGEDSVPFFDDEGKTHPEIQKVIEFLEKARQGAEAVVKATAMANECGLLEEWPMAIKAMDDRAEHKIGGVSRINEAALNALSSDDLIRLRDVGGLALAYAQLISMRNIGLLSVLARAQADARAALASRMAIPEGSFISDDDDELKIDWNAFLKDDEPKQ